jgi:hypothetical protein
MRTANDASTAAVTTDPTSKNAHVTTLSNVLTAICGRGR